MIAFAFLICLMAAGTIGYMVIEGYTLNEGIYQTAITLSTVGFTEVRPFSEAGRIFTMFLIFGGVGGAAYTLSSTVQLAIEGQFNEYFGRRRMEHDVASLQGHVVICGFGRVGQEIARELAQYAVPFVVVEQDAAMDAALRHLKYFYIHGQATDEQVLRAAGTPRASALVAASDLDTDNTYIVLIARAMNPDLYIVARASHAAAESPLRMAGASRVISPYNVAGHQMAAAVLYPSMNDLMVTGARSGDSDIVVAHFQITADSELEGRSIGSIGDRSTIPSVLALRRGSQFVSHPERDIVLRCDDEIFVAATAKQVQRFARSTQSASAAQPVVPAKASRPR